MRLSRRTDLVPLGPEITRLVALGDPHGDLAGLDAVLEREVGPATVLVSVGDNVGYCGAEAASALCRRLAERGLRSVHGNHEAYVEAGDGLTAEAMAWCAALPMRLRFQAAAAPGLEVVVVHTLLEVDGQDDPVDGDAIGYQFVDAANVDLLPDAEGARVVICGHSHGPAIYEIRGYGEVRTRRLALEDGARVDVRLRDGARYVVDAGSLALPAHHPEPAQRDLATYAVVDLMKRTVGLRAAAK